MCTIVVRKDRKAPLPLVVAANRDEFYGRPTVPPERLRGGAVGGRDLEKGGTWLGVHPAGLFVGLTNQRPTRPPEPRPVSRGRVVLDALASGSVDGVDAVLDRLDPTQTLGFNLLYGDAERLRVAYVRHEPGSLAREDLDDGLHVLPNDRIGSPEFPRAERAHDLAAAAFAAHADWPDLAEALGRVLGDRAKPDLELVRRVTPPNELRIDLEVVRELQALCIHTPFYGTRSAALIALAPGRVAHYLHAEGPPSETPFVDVTDLLESP